MELRKNLRKMYFFSKVFKSKRLRVFGVALFLWLTMFFAISSTMGSGKYNYELGDTAREDIVITSDIVDDAKTTQLRDEAEEEVEPVLYIDPTVQIEVKKQIRQFFERLYEVRSDFADDEDVLVQVYTGMETESKLNEDQLKALVLMDQRKLEEIETVLGDLVLQTMATGISSDEISKGLTDMDVYLNSLEYEDELQLILSKLISIHLRANKFIDTEATERVIQARRSEVDTVIIESGTTILRQGSTVSSEHLRLLNLAGLLYSNAVSDKLKVYGILGFSLVIVITLFAYLSIFHEDILNDSKKSVLLVSTFLLIFLTSKALNLISIYIIPVSLFPILIGLSIGPAVGIVVSGLLAVAITVWNDASLSALIVMMIGSTIAGLSISKAYHRSGILMTGGYIAIIKGALIFALGMMSGNAGVETTWLALEGAVGGLLAAVLALGLLPVIESLFHILTPMKLLELSNPNHPVLKRLLIEAPGTYHHSILVGNLAEAAAHDVGANSLLSRVGAFYHDIGKLERPYYFKENQITAENPHDRLIPAVSASIIRRHSTYGETLGEKHKLPREIIDIILQHHGTTCIKYFYHKACEDAKDGNPVSCADYSYEGPVPSSREAAIVMLADSVEAAVRSLQEPTKEHILEMVDKIISSKMQEGQLEASELTFKDLGKIKSAFMVVLTGIFHERIEYPDLSEFDVRR